MVWIKYTRAYTLLKGLLIISAFLLVAYIFKMNTILWIVSKLSSVLIMAVIVIFQPELRKIVEQLGQKRIMSAIIPFDVGKEVKERFTDKTINELVKAVSYTHLQTFMCPVRSAKANDTIVKPWKLSIRTKIFMMC